LYRIIYNNFENPKYLEKGTIMIEKELNEGKESSVQVGSAFLDVLFIIAKARVFLISIIFLGVATAVVVALLTPKAYKASASVLPAAQNDLLSSLSGISSLAKNLSPLKSLGSLSGSDEIDKYLSILRSNSVQRDIIEKFNLREVYDLKDDPFWKVERELAGNVEIEIEDEGHLSISVLDENPERAAAMANYMVELLNEINTKLHITNARYTKDFVEKRYLQNIADIIQLESDMKVFQEKYGVIAVPEQIEATITALSKVYVDLTKEEVEYNVMKLTLAEDNPMLKTKEVQLAELNRQVKNMVDSKGPLNSDTKVLIPLNRAPELANKYLNLFRNLEIQYKIAEFITPVYEQARIEEARNTPSVLVLDKAYPPERKAKPKIALYALIGFVISMIVGLFLIFTMEMLRKLSVINSVKYEYVISSLGPVQRFLPGGSTRKELKS
jgi:tyrosine-protein kinase Etk/Wzc